MKRVGILILLCSCFGWGQGQTTANITPASTGQKLGSVNQRWDAFIQNLDVSGTLTLSGPITISPAAFSQLLSSNNGWTGNQTFGGLTTFTGAVSSAAPVKETRSPQNLVVAGDSISHGNQVLLGDEWPSQAMNLPMFRERGTLTNTAVVGYTCANMTSDYVTKVQPLRPSVTGVPTLLSTLIGRNNFSGGNTAATVESCVSAYWAQARTDGFKTIAFTVYDTTGIVSETERNAYNTWVRANGSLYDYLVDTDAAFPSFTDTTLISDQIHPTARGHNLIANLVNAAVGGVSNFPTTAKSEVQAAAIVRAPIVSSEPSATAAGSVFAYNLTTSMNRSSYERGVMFWNANVFEIGSEMADPSGFGLIARSTRLKSALDIKFAAAGTDWWQLRTNGPLFCITDGTCDIGQATNNRPNNVNAKNIVDAIFLRAYNSAGGPGEVDVFNTVDSVTAPVNFERVSLKYVANEARLTADNGGTGVARNLRIMSNAAIAIGTTGTTTITAFLQATATLTYTAIAAQTCQEQTVTVTNASTTNFGVSVAPRASLGNTNLNWSGWVSVAGTVSVRVCNPSAASITPSAVAWGVTVTQ